MNATHLSAETSRLFRDSSEAMKGYVASLAVFSFIVASIILSALIFPKPEIVGVIFRQIPNINEIVSVEAIERALTRGRAAQVESERGTYVIRDETPKPKHMQMIVPREIDVPINNVELPTELGFGKLENTRNREIDNSIAKAIVKTETRSDEVIEFAEIEPAFDYDKLQRSIRYPELARRNGIEGKVVVRALVELDGSASVVEIYSSENVLLDQEALRSIKSIVFTPAKQNGTAVRCWVLIPINFRLR